MSGFAFSHQFSQRWLATPAPVKQTIIQELDDIVTLLQPETDLDSYRFSVPNLHDKVEQLMAIEAIRQERLHIEQQKREREEQERLEQERQEQERLEREKIEQERLEQQRLEQEKLAQIQIEQAEAERLEQERLENERLEIERLENERLEQDRLAIAELEKERAIAKQAHQQDKQSFVSDEKADSVANPNLTADNIEPHTTEIIYAISDHHSQSLNNNANNENATTVMPATSSNVEAIKQQIIAQLQAHIDTYLQESMDFMKDDLNQWLSSEVDNQLKQHLSQNDNL